tara:strand:+ start:1879 stop:4323 length:2445 start_codon:yes stop_codon:yes gene_type:complete
MSKLIGTNPNQIPSNADLGSAAYSDQKEFLKSSGSNLSAIEKTVHSGVANVFVYDTTQDTDGGLWRKRCQDTSWYNEKLNTSTRGSRREFPSIAVIVAETSRVIIFDGDDPNLPMWMTFEADRTPITWLSWYTSGSGIVNDLTALNGIMVWAQSGGAPIISFPGDDVRLSYSGSSEYEMIKRAIVYRNNAGGGQDVGGGDMISLNHYSCASVGMKVLPDDPIDPATGIPAPTILVGTASTGGITVIRGNRTSYNIIATSQNNGIAGIAITGDNKFIYEHVYGCVYGSDPGATTSANYHNQTSNYISRISNQSSHQDATTPSVPGSGVKFPTPMSKTTNKFAVAGNTAQAGFAITKDIEKGSVPYGYLCANVTPTYNTGWQVGDTLCTALSSVETSPYTSGELITNGGFDSNTTGWTAVGAGNSIARNSSGQLEVTRGGGGQAAVARVNCAMKAGRTYNIRFNLITNGGGGNNVIRLGTSTTAYTHDVASTGSGTGIFDVEYTAPEDFNHLWIYAYPTATTVIDDISVSPRDLDRSGKASHLSAYHHTQTQAVHECRIHRTPVAPGADLVGYNFDDEHNFMVAHLSQNIGTGDFHLQGWIKPHAIGDGYFHMASVSGTRGGNGQSSTTGFTLKMAAAAAGASGWVPYFYSGSGGADVGTYDVSNVNVKIGDWSQVVLQRRGGYLSIYINGKLKKAGGSNAFSITDRFLHIGYGQGSEKGGDADLALVRISMGSISDEKIYENWKDENSMFQPGANSTMYGTTGSVGNMAWDQVEDKLHVGNAQGRSVFSGLTRTDHSTEAVTLSLSASNGLVAEE